ncbi:MAG TPA: gamma-glutamyl-gamma-aminobutyrate hydrolase family protein [Terriglobales bacterium]|nr:gamma-glutamyl-gamma-aminobutyrate hydrolase family protein [Terriglobales bacterium]
MRPQRLKPNSKQSIYRSAEALRHPKPSEKAVEELASSHPSSRAEAPGAPLAKAGELKMGDVKTIAPRIAIPVPHSGDRAYAERALPQYEEAVRGAGGVPVRIELELTPVEVMKQVEGCDAVLLPGSKADLDPQAYGAARHEKTAAADTKRDMVDELLLRDAYQLHKPVLGICYGLQSLNVHRSGSLLQHIESAINHSAGRAVAKAHTVAIEAGSKLAEIVGASSGTQKTVAVNSSHHQSADTVGNGLRVVARCAQDGVIEALEGTAPGHFVLAVQWHPERSVNDEAELAESARAIFRAFVEAARAKRAELAGGLERHLT